MHRIFIAEDDIVQCDVLKKMITRHYPDWKICCVYNRTSGLAHIQESIHDNFPFTLFLLDIQLTKNPSDRGGFELAKEIRKYPAYYRSPILFLTAIPNEMQLALSEFHCYNYITKPYTEDTVLYQLTQMQLTGYMDTTLEVTDTSRVLHRLLQRDIYMIQSRSHVLNIVTTSVTLSTRSWTLSGISQLLSDDFVRCHHQYIVNRHYVDSYDPLMQCLHVREQIIPVGKTYREDMRQLLGG